MAFIAIYITNSSAEEAHKVAAHLLQKKLVACANIFPVSSSYYWQGALQNEQEFVALVKTRPALWEAVKQEVAAVHSYQTPCIMRFEVSANEDYEAWIEQETCGS
ncbi:divalent-cation tolerance protein CutA [Sphingobacteriales bacterium UPWRP_1]|nr:hypothetical protein B6N25_14705 [Sphingobacteriales bacterium TSM_CSS]PSJ78950.1 divalent-cation tolerance protein CutA [Sphingobacteriales bacterium UPWRP_1]